MPLSLTPRTPGVLSATSHTEGTFPPSAIHAGDLPWFNVLDYGAVGGGVVNDTIAIQATHDAAFLVGGEMIFPHGTYLCGTINWRYVPMRGEGRRGSVIKGLPGQDILHVNASDNPASYPGWHIRDLKFILNDSVNAAASFPQRGGVGNAVFAVDFANGATTPVPSPYQGEFVNLWLEALSGTVNGQNNSAGFYMQHGPTQCLFSNVRILRFRYGYRQDYPTSNLTSVELAPDHNRYESMFFDHNERQMRLVNEDSTSMDNIVMHGTTPLSGLELIGVTSSIRTSCGSFSASRVYIEAHDGRPWTISGERHHFQEAAVFQSNSAASAAAPPLISCNHSVFDSCQFGAKGATQLTVTGSQNKITYWPVYDNALTSTWAATELADDQGASNQIVHLGNPTGASSRRRAVEASGPGYRILHQRDSVSGMFGHVDPPFVSGADLIINPREWSPSYFGNTEGGSANGDYSYVVDSTSDFGMALRIKNGQFNMVSDYANGTYALVVGRFLPKSKVRMYIRAKSVGSGGSQSIAVDQSTPGGTNIASFTPAWTTSYVTKSLDLDLTSVAAGTGLAVYTDGALGRDLDISCIIFRPFHADMLLVSGITQTSAAASNGFYGATPVTQPAANADTSGATLPQLETEVNQLKATLRSLGLLAT